MDNFSLIYHNQLKSVICTDHHILLKRSNIFSHVQQEHSSHHHHSFILSKLTSVLTNLWNVPEKLMDIEPGHLYPQFQGLPIHLGYQCPDCVYVSISHKKTRNHVRQHHHHPYVIQYIPVQRYARNKPPFPIIPTSSSSPTTGVDILINTLASAVNLTFKPPLGAYTENTRLVSQWLLRTKWPTIIQNRDIGQLYKVVQKPPCDDKLLQQACLLVRAFTKLATQNISLLPDLVLQRLNTPDKAKRYPSCSCYLMLVN